MKKAIAVILIAMFAVAAGGLPHAQASYISLSQYSVTLGVSNTASVIISSDVDRNFYVSNNSNSSAVSAWISGSTLTVYGIASGTSQISICTANNLNCTGLSVTVLSSAQPIGGISLSQTYMNLKVGQSGSVTISYGGAYTNNFQVYNPNPSIVSASVSGSTLYVYGLNQGLATLTVSAINGNFGSANLYVTVTAARYRCMLINDNGTFYMVYKNLKSGFSNWQAFVNLGYRLENVSNGSTYAYANSGYVINTSNGPHPWGTWIINGSTVYFVHDSGLIPIATYDVFVSNGGQDQSLVPANVYDFQKPILSIMSSNDTRLN